MRNYYFDFYCIRIVNGLRMVITKELYRSYIINMIDSSQKKEKIRLKSRVKSVIKKYDYFYA